MEIDKINLLSNRIEIIHKNGKLWDSQPNIQFNEKILTMNLIFLDKVYYKKFNNKEKYLHTKNHCDFYF